MKNTFKSTILLVAICILCSCDELLSGLPDQTGRVTLTLDADLTRTTLVNDNRVLWQDGDRISINGKMYYIVLDSLQTGSAKVYDVVEADEYYAGYAFSYGDITMDGYTLNGGHILSGQPYVEGGFGQYMNPMTGYSTGTTIKMHNMASILKIGVQGEHTINRLSVTGEGIMAGQLKWLMESIRNGEFDAYITNDASNTVEIELGWNPVKTEGLTYFYFVIAPHLEKNGIVITMRDELDNVYIQSTFNEMEFTRSEIKEMEEFSFKKAEPVHLAVNNVTHDSVEYEISGEPGGIILSRVITKKKYDTYKAEGRLDSLFHNISDACSYHRANEKGRLTRNIPELKGEMDYVIVASYGDAHGGIGETYTAEFTTGKAPVVEEEKPVISWTSDNSFDSPCFELKLGEHVTRFRYTFMKDIVYSNMKYFLGMSDTDILDQRNRSISTTDIELAKTSSYILSPKNISYSIDNDYVFLFEATLDDGSKVTEIDMRRFDRTKYDEYKWQMISLNATVTSDIFEFGRVMVEKAAGTEIYRIHNFNIEEHLFFEGFDYNMMHAFTGNPQLIINATDPEAVTFIYPYTYLPIIRENQDGYIYPIYLMPNGSSNNTFDGNTFHINSLRLSEERMMGSFSYLYDFSNISINLNIESSTEEGVWTESFTKNPTKTPW